MAKESKRKTNRSVKDTELTFQHFSAHPPISVTHPELAKQWHKSRNGALCPDDVTYGSTQKIWWQCPDGRDHFWTSSPKDRLSKGKLGKCPFCIGYRVCRSNSLATKYPKIAKDWNYEKNEKYSPQKITAASSQHVWWRCSEHHEWQATVKSRTRLGHNCPYCSGNKACETNSLASQFPHIAQEWNYEKNENALPEKLTAGSSKSVWWRCARNHEWRTTVKERTSGGTNCPFCIGKRASDYRNLALDRPDLAMEWHPSKNGVITPGDVTFNSHKKVWWQCLIHKSHVWLATPNGRVNGGTGCPYCAGKKVSSLNSLAKKSPKIATEWHPKLNGTLTPSDVSYGSAKQYWWQCSKNSDHVWKASVYDRWDGRRCPLCDDRLLDKSKSLATKFPAIASQWHPDNELSPDNVAAFSSKKVWWQCDKNKEHMWQANIGNRTARGTGCPFCPKTSRKRYSASGQD